MTSNVNPTTLPLRTREQVGRHGRQVGHPAWPPFTGPVERRVPAYIAFADRDDLVRYLRRRALIEVA